MLMGGLFDSDQYAMQLIFVGLAEKSDRKMQFFGVLPPNIDPPKVRSKSIDVRSGRLASLVRNIDRDEYSFRRHFASDFNGC